MLPDREKLFLLGAGAGDALDRQRCAAGFLGDSAVLLDNEVAGGFVLFQVASNSAGTRRWERCEPSSYTTSKNTNSPLGLVPGFFAIASYSRIPFLPANPIVRGSRHAIPNKHRALPSWNSSPRFSLQIGSTKISTNRGAP